MSQSPHHLPTLVTVLISITILQMRRAQQGGFNDQVPTTREGAAEICTRVCLTPQTKLSVSVLSSQAGLIERGMWPGPDYKPQGLASALLEWVLGAGLGGSPMGPQGSSSRLPSPRRWESELRLASADRGSVLMKLCLWQSRESQWADRGPQPLAPLFHRRAGWGQAAGARLSGWGLPPVELGVVGTLGPTERAQ